MLKLILIIACAAALLVSTEAAARNVPDGTLTYKIVRPQQFPQERQATFHAGDEALSLGSKDMPGFGTELTQPFPAIPLDAVITWKFIPNP